jgi:hypothetical protein
MDDHHFSYITKLERKTPHMRPSSQELVLELAQKLKLAKADS